MTNPKSPDIILTRRATVDQWPNSNPFPVGAIVAEVDTDQGEITLQTAQGLLDVAREILQANNSRTVQKLTFESRRRFGSALKGVYQVVGTAKTDARPNCQVLPASLNEKIPADLPLLPLTILSQ